jgi:hypothetical protein
VLPEASQLNLSDINICNKMQIISNRIGTLFSSGYRRSYP